MPGQHARAWPVLAVVAVTAAATVLATSRFGVGLTPDSVHFVDGAVSLADGMGFSRRGRPMTIFPPGYPAVLAVGEQLGLGAVTTARWVGVVSFAFTTALGYVLLRRHVRSSALVLAGTAIIGCSAILLEVFEEALSEHLFIVAVLLTILVAEELVARPKDLRLLAAGVALVWAGFALRYAGLVLLPYLAVIVLATRWHAGRLRALAWSVAFAIVSLAAPLLVMARNVSEGVGPTGGRHSAAASLVTNLRRTATILSGWLSFDGRTGVHLAAVAVGLLAVAITIVVLVLPVRARIVARTREVWPLALFVALYLVYLIASATAVAFAPINDRYLIPVYVPMVVLGVWVFEGVRARLGTRGRVVLTAVAAVWLVLNVLRFGEYTVRSARDGAGGYATVAWERSPLMDEVRGLDPEVRLVSNDSKAVQVHAQRLIEETANKTFSGSAERTDELERFVELVRCEGTVDLAWFSAPGDRRGRLYTPEELADAVQVERVTTVADGALYSLSPLPSPDGGGATGDPEAPCDARVTTTSAGDAPET